MTLMNILRQSEQSKGGGRSLKLSSQERTSVSYILENFFGIFFRKFMKRYNLGEGDFELH